MPASTLTVSGNVTLYSAGAINIGTITLNQGASLTVYVEGTTQFTTVTNSNANPIPSNLILYSTYQSSVSATDYGVIFGNNTNIYAAVFAPKSKINLRRDICKRNYNEEQWGSSL
jgi:hypothetical protein